MHLYTNINPIDHNIIIQNIHILLNIPIHLINQPIFYNLPQLHNLQNNHHIH